MRRDTQRSQRSQRSQRPNSARSAQRALSIFISALSAFSAVNVAYAQPSTTRTHVQTLASEKFEGRLAGSNGERLASEYLAGELKKIGVKPLPGEADFQLPVEVTAGTRDRGSSIGINGQ